VWDLKIPPRVQNFLLLFSQNKILTRDNLRKRGIPKPLECSLCKEIESVPHLFFDCLVSSLLWYEVQKFFDVEIIDFLSLASKWLCNKRYLQLNVVTSAIIRSIWNNRSSIVFNHNSWLNMKQAWQWVLGYLRIWRTPFKDQSWEMVDHFTTHLIRKLQVPLVLMPDSRAWTSAGTQFGIPSPPPKHMV
jgi:hypothetical protein